MANKNRMFSSMTNIMTKCWVPNGTQTYWDSVKQDMKKIIYKIILNPAKGNSTISADSEKWHRLHLIPSHYSKSSAGLVEISLEDF